MAEEENFELIPHKQFLELKRDMESIKKNPFGPRTEEILMNMTELSRSLDEMVKAFKEATESTQNQELQDLTAMINPVSVKIDTLFEHNKKIAQGVLAIADMLKDTLTLTNDLQNKVSAMAAAPRRDEMSELRNPSVQPIRQQFEEARPFNVPIPPPQSSTIVRNAQTAFEPPKFEPPPLPNANSMPSGFSNSTGVEKKDKRFIVF